MENIKEINFFDHFREEGTGYRERNGESWHDEIYTVEYTAVLVADDLKNGHCKYVNIPEDVLKEMEK